MIIRTGRDVNSGKSKILCTSARLILIYAARELPPWHDFVNTNQSRGQGQLSASSHVACQL
jgi:hypothetical protein